MKIARRSFMNWVKWKFLAIIYLQMSCKQEDMSCDSVENILFESNTVRFVKGERVRVSWISKTNTLCKIEWLNLETGTSIIIFDIYNLSSENLEFIVPSILSKRSVLKFTPIDVDYNCEYLSRKFSIEDGIDLEISSLKFLDGNDDISINYTSVYFGEIIILRENDVILEVLSRNCTHSGCAINYDGNKFICPCHGSEFTQNGCVTIGLANINLYKYEFLHFAIEDKIRIFNSMVNYTC